MSSFVVQGSRALCGRARVPADKSISHRAVMFASLANGTSVLRHFSGGLDNRATLGAFRSMGVRFTEEGQTLSIEGVGLDGLREPAEDIDCGNSGTTMRLLSGLLCGQTFSSRLIGDASLSKRPMRRVLDPLRARGAHVDGASGKKPGELYAPLAVRAQPALHSLTGLEYAMPVASAQVKSALLLSGLYASGVTAVQEPVLSRDHTERMLESLGVPLQTAGTMVVFDPSEWTSRIWPGVDWELPGDPSSAAFLHAAALMVPGSDLVLEGVCTNPSRTGFLDAARAMGDRCEVVPKGSAAGGEPFGDLHIQHSPLSARQIGGELVVRMIDEVPVYCVLAAATPGETVVRDAAELRVKESDRIARTCELLRAFGVSCEEQADGLVIRGGAKLHGATVKSHDDHRIAMSAVLLGLIAEGETRIEDVSCVDTSFPGFAEMLRSLGADVAREDTR